MNAADKIDLAYSYRLCKILPTFKEKSTSFQVGCWDPVALQADILGIMALQGSARRAAAALCTRIIESTNADYCVLFANDGNAAGWWEVIGKSEDTDETRLAELRGALSGGNAADARSLLVTADAEDGTIARLVMARDTGPIQTSTDFVATIGHIASLLVQSFSRDQRFKRYRSVFRATADLTCLVSPDHRCVAANAGLARIVGKEIVELEGLPLDLIFGDAYGAILRPAVDAAFEGNPTTQHDWLTFACGKRLYLDIETAPKREPGGRVGTVMMRLFDITRRHQAFRALSRSEEKYRSLIESLTDFVWEVDLTGQFTFVNSASGRILGYSKAEVLGRHFVDFMIDEERQHSADAMQTLLADPRPVRGLINRMRHREGQVVTLEGTILPMRDETGELCGFRGIERDLTQSRKQQQLRRRFEAIVEATTDFISTSDAEGRIQYINRAGRELLGFADESEYTGHSLELVHPDEDHAKIREHGLVEAQRNGSWQGEVRLRRVDGSVIPVSQVILAHRGSNGAVDYYSTIMRDLSERMATEQKLQGYADDLRRVSQQLFTARENELRHLARELHDEIGQSLTALKINLDTLRLAASPNQQTMDGCIEIADTLLGQVRNLSLDLRPTMLDDLGLEASLRWFVERCHQNTGLEVVCDIAPGLGRFPAPIETACFRIIQEALTNTVRHARAGKASIVVSTEPARLLLRVEDDGHGFDVERCLQDARWGHSFGLAGMHERASLLGGALRVRSVHGRGTTIEAELPH